MIRQRIPQSRYCGQGRAGVNGINVSVYFGYGGCDFAIQRCQSRVEISEYTFIEMFIERA